MFTYPIYNHIWRNISTICRYITRLGSNEIFSPSNKIHQEVGQAKDLAPLYKVCVTSGSHVYFKTHKEHHVTIVGTDAAVQYWGQFIAVVDCGGGGWQDISLFWTHRKFMVFLDSQRCWLLDLQHHNEYKFITVRCFKSCIPIWRLDDQINSMMASSRCMIVHPHVAHKFRTNWMLCDGRCLNSLDL
jgi:hypothetical protein